MLASALVMPLPLVTLGAGIGGTAGDVLVAASVGIELVSTMDYSSVTHTIVLDSVLRQ